MSRRCGCGCGREVPPSTNPMPRKYYDYKCRRRAETERLRGIATKRRCAWCNAGFLFGLYNHSLRRYCSAACQREAHRSAAREARQRKRGGARPRMVKAPPREFHVEASVRLASVRDTRVVCQTCHHEKLIYPVWDNAIGTHVLRESCACGAGPLRPDAVGPMVRHYDQRERLERELGSAFASATRLSDPKHRGKGARLRNMRQDFRSEAAA